MTITTAPTDEEIRAALVRSWSLDRNPITLMAAPETSFEDVMSALRSLADPIHDFDHMRQSEIDRLDGSTTRSSPTWWSLATRLRKLALEATVRAERRFFDEHPDAPWIATGRVSA